MIFYAYNGLVVYRKIYTTRIKKFFFLADIHNA